MHNTLSRTRMIVLCFSLIILLSMLFIYKVTYAQSSLTNSTKSEKRRKNMVRYQETFDQYAPLKSSVAKNAMEEFRTFLSIATVRSQKCLAETDTQKRDECKRELKADHSTSKWFNRLLKYYLIEEGNPNVCVKADLGGDTELMARGFNPAIAKRAEAKKLAGQEVGPKETGLSELSEVFLCTGKDGKKKLRIQDNSGTLLRLSPEDQLRPELQINNVPPKGNVDMLIKKLGLTKGDGSITASPNPCSATSCSSVMIDWSVTSETADPVVVKGANGTQVATGRTGKATIANPQNGDVYNLYANDKLLGSVEIKVE